MDRFFLGLLSVLAIALFISNAIAEGDNMSNTNNNMEVVETVTFSSSVEPNVNTSGMMPVAEDPGVEVAPMENSNTSYFEMEEDVYIEENQDGQ